MNNLTPIPYLDTTHLSEKGSAQVQEYLSFVKERFDDIRKGETAKQEIAKHYLGLDALTDGADKLISSLNHALGISKGYLSQIRSANKLANSFDNSISGRSLKRFVEQHPVTVQYRMRNLDEDTIYQKMQTGECFTIKETEALSNPKTTDATPNPAPEPVKTEFQELCSRAKPFIESDDYQYITGLSEYEVYTKTFPAVARGLMQKLSDYKAVGSEDRMKALAEIKRLAAEAEAKEYRSINGAAYLDK